MRFLSLRAGTERDSLIEFLVFSVHMILTDIDSTPQHFQKKVLYFLLNIWWLIDDS